MSHAGCASRRRLNVARHSVTARGGGSPPGTAAWPMRVARTGPRHAHVHGAVADAVTVAAGAVGTSLPRRDPRSRGLLRLHRGPCSPSCARCADTRASRRPSRARIRIEAADGLRGVRRTRPDGASRSAQRGVAGLRGIDRVAPRLAGVERCGRASHARARARVGVGLLRKDGVCSFGSCPPPAQEA